MNSDNMSVGALVGGVLGVFFLVGCLVIGVRACEVGNAATFDRAEQDIRTKNFENSSAYRAGLRRDFDELIMAYTQAKSDDEKKAVLATIRHRAEGVQPDLVPQNVKNLLNKETK